MAKSFEQLDVEDLQKKKFMLATPLYGGNCEGEYLESLIKLTQTCTANKIPFQTFFISNESLIPRARNYCVDAFLRSDCTHLVFVDADIHFNPLDLLFMVYFSEEVGSSENDYSVITGAYPKKTIAWEKVKKAVDKGMADNDPNQLANFVGDYAFNLLPGTKSIAPLEIMPILHGATGFMCIHRSVFEKYQQAYPERSYYPDHTRLEHFDGSRKIFMYFDTEICDETQRYLSEDYYFSKYVRKMGVNVWLCPWFLLDHIGKYKFKGNLLATLQSGAVHSDVTGKKKK